MRLAKDAAVKLSNRELLDSEDKKFKAVFAGGRAGHEFSWNMQKTSKFLLT